MNFKHLTAIKHKPPRRTYIYVVLLSVATEPQLYIHSWGGARTIYAKRVTAIVLPIDVQNVHWYLPILHLDKTGITMMSKHYDIRNINSFLLRKIPSHPKTTQPNRHQPQFQDNNEHTKIAIVAPNSNKCRHC